MIKERQELEKDCPFVPKINVNSRNNLKDGSISRSKVFERNKDYRNSFNSTQFEDGRIKKALKTSKSGFIPESKRTREE